MTETLALSAIGVNIATLAAILYGLWRMMVITAEAREARKMAIAATRRAEDAAHTAAAKVEEVGRLTAASVAEAAQAQTVMADNIQKIELATNSMKDALVAATAKASNLEGRAEQRAETEAKTP